MLRATLRKGSPTLTVWSRMALLRIFGRDRNLCIYGYRAGKPSSMQMYLDKYK